MTMPTQHNAPGHLRANERQNVSLAARLVQDGQSCPCQLLNISVGGAKIRINRRYPNGTRLRLAIDPFGEFDCETAWQRDEDIGLRFVEQAETLAEVIVALAVYG